MDKMWVGYFSGIISALICLGFLLLIFGEINFWTLLGATLGTVLAGITIEVWERIKAKR